MLHSDPGSPLSYKNGYSSLDTQEGGAVSLEVRDEGEHAVFACTDTGIGIAEPDFETLFQEFDRSSNPAAHAVPGTGLGLAIVRRIVERHGGRIWVESDEGSGAVFAFQLPAARREGGD